MPLVIDLNEVGGGGELLYSQEELCLQLIFQMPEGISSPSPHCHLSPTLLVCQDFGMSFLWMLTLHAGFGA